MRLVPTLVFAATLSISSHAIAQRTEITFPRPDETIRFADLMIPGNDPTLNEFLAEAAALASDVVTTEAKIDEVRRFVGSRLTTVRQRDPRVVGLGAPGRLGVHIGAFIAGGFATRTVQSVLLHLALARVGIHTHISYAEVAEHGRRPPDEHAPTSIESFVVDTSTNTTLDPTDERHGLPMPRSGDVLQYETDVGVESGGTRTHYLRMSLAARPHLDPQTFRASLSHAVERHAAARPRGLLARRVTVVSTYGTPTSTRRTPVVVPPRR